MIDVLSASHRLAQLPMPDAGIDRQRNKLIAAVQAGAIALRDINLTRTRSRPTVPRRGYPAAAACGRRKRAHGRRSRVLPSRSLAVHEIGELHDVLDPLGVGTLLPRRGRGAQLRLQLLDQARQRARAVRRVIICVPGSLPSATKVSDMIAPDAATAAGSIFEVMTCTPSAYR